jgi:hypothetical protein
MKLSPTMLDCVKYTRTHGGILHRFPGGYWANLDWKHGELSFGTRTAEALVTRGVAEYSDWQEGRNGRFPIALTLNSNRRASEVKDAT